jgi:hypothetical protein
MFNIKYLDFTFINDITDYNILKICILIFLKIIITAIFTKFGITDTIFYISTIIYLSFILPFRIFDLKYAIIYSIIISFFLIFLLSKIFKLLFKILNVFSILR